MPSLRTRGALSPFHNTYSSVCKIQEFLFVNNLYFKLTYLIHGRFSVTLFVRLNVLFKAQNVQKAVKRTIDCRLGVVLCVFLAIVWFFFALVGWSARKFGYRLTTCVTDLAVFMSSCYSLRLL